MNTVKTFEFVKLNSKWFIYGWGFFISLLLVAILDIWISLIWFVYVFTLTSSIIVSFIWSWLNLSNIYKKYGKSNPEISPECTSESKIFYDKKYSIIYGREPEWICNIPIINISVISESSLLEEVKKHKEIYNINKTGLFYKFFVKDSNLSKSRFFKKFRTGCYDIYYIIKINENMYVSYMIDNTELSNEKIVRYSDACDAIHIVSMDSYVKFRKWLEGK